MRALLWVMLLTGVVLVVAPAIWAIEATAAVVLRVVGGVLLIGGLVWLISLLSHRAPATPGR